MKKHPKTPTVKSIAAAGPTQNPLNALSLDELFACWSEFATEEDDRQTEAITESIKAFVEENGLAANPIHLVRALIRFTTKCNDYVIECAGSAAIQSHRDA